MSMVSTAQEPEHLLLSSFIQLVVLYVVRCSSVEEGWDVGDDLDAMQLLFKILALQHQAQNSP